MKPKFLAQLLFLFFVLASARAQWAPVASGTAQTLHGVKLLGSGVGLTVGNAGTILKTADLGATWSALVSGTTQNLYAVEVLNDNEAVVVGDNGVILRTTDSGATWGSVTSGVHDSLRSVSFSGANGICGGTSQDILYSTDSGASWHVSQKAFFGGGFFGAQMLTPTLGFVAGQNSIFQAFVGVTVDGGVSWTFHPFYFNGNEGNCNDVHFFDAMTGITSGALFDSTGAIARTTNGAADWVSTIYPLALEGIDFPLSETGWVVGLGGTILKSTDAGVTFAPQESGSVSDLFDVSFASDGMTGVAVGQSGTILRTVSGGEDNGLTLISAASRKGPFEVDLPLSGTPGIESRIASLRRPLTIVFKFEQGIAAVDPIGSASCGSLDDVRTDPEDPTQVLATYRSERCNGQNVTVTISHLTDDDGHTLATASVTMTLLLGDVTGDGVVDDADVRSMSDLLGETTSNSNFRADLDADHRVDRDDARLVRKKAGSARSH